MHDKDIITKQLLKSMTLGMVHVLLGLDIIELEMLESEEQRVEDRRADFVAKVTGHQETYILHIEMQNDNQKAMPWRMLRYLTDIGLAYPGLPIKQYLIYIGRGKLTMAAGLAQTGLSYEYQVIDFHNIDCETLFQQDTPEALVFAILSDFRRFTSREVIQHILQRLQALTGENVAAFREYILMLEVLSGNRDLKQILHEEEKMLTQVKYSDLPSYDLGMEMGLEQGIEIGIEKGILKGIEKGIEKGVIKGKELGRQQEAAKLFLVLLQRKFGGLSQDLQEKVRTADPDQIEAWSERVFDANSPEELLNT